MMKIQQKVSALSKKLNAHANVAVRFLDSNWFLYIVIALFVVQALWIAFSFRYPMIYDEVRHVPIIQYFSENISPFVWDQPAEYDYLGSIDITTGSTSSLYHYLLSFPYRLVSLITDSVPLQIIFLRSINVALVAIGLYLYAILFRRAGIRGGYINLGLLFFVLLPLVPHTAAHVNYDNLLFPLTALFFLASLQLINNKVTWRRIVNVVLVGCFATLVKFTFLPVFAISLVALAAIVYRRERSIRAAWDSLVLSIRESTRGELIIGVAAVVAVVGVFIFTYTRNIVEYGAPRPQCEQVLSVERCQSNAVAKRNMDARATAESRQQMLLSKYSRDWYENMINFTTMTGASLPDGSVVLNRQIPLINQAVYFGVIISALIIAATWRQLEYGRTMRFLTINAVFLIAVVFLKNYSIYLDLRFVFATQPRYLLTIVPIVLVFTALGVAYLIRKWPITLKLLVVVLVSLLLTQGGGVVTHILKSENSWYWQNQTVISANETAKKILAPFVKEN